MWKELSCKSLKLGMLEITFPRSSSVLAQQVEMAHVPLCPLPTHLAPNGAVVAVGCAPALCFDCNGVTQISQDKWCYMAPHKNTRFKCVCICMGEDNHCRNSSGMAD